jgi:hypothetical protein
MKWLALVSIFACAKVANVEVDPSTDAGVVAVPEVAQIDPAPGAVASDAQFTVTFSEPMDEGVLLASSGRSETVVLATDAQVEAVAAAIAHDSLSTYERSLLVPASAAIAAGGSAITLSPDVAFAPGNYWLLVSPRLKDQAGEKLQGDGGRWEFTVAAPPAHALLLSPAAGSQAPENLTRVRANAPSGKVALVAADGTVLASADASGDVSLQLSSPLVAGAQISLSLDGAIDPTQSFTVASCARTTPPALQNGAAQLNPTDTNVTADLALDWPASVEVQVGLVGDGAPCVTGSCTTIDAQVTCSPPACGPQTFTCTASIEVDGLQPATDYALRVVAKDDFGFSTVGPVQPFSTVAPLPHLIISEVMVAPFSPEEEGEYVEILNQGPGVAVLDPLALMGDDGVVRMLSGTLPPTPVLLFPGQRALAVGAAFDVSRYGDLPAVPILRASTQKLLSHGLNDLEAQPFQLVLGIVPIELASFPGGKFHCPSNASVQRDETQPPDQDGTWSCGPAGGTPGAAP